MWNSPVEKQISPDLMCGLEFHTVWKQITCANGCIWDWRSHLIPCCRVYFELECIFPRWQKPVAYKNFQFLMGNCDFLKFLTYSKENVLHVGQVHGEGGPRLRSVAGECEWSRWKWARANVLGDPVEALGRVQKAGCGWVSSPEFQHSISEEALMSCNESGESTVLSLIASGRPLVWLF